MPLRSGEVPVGGTWDAADLDWLQRLIGDWDLVADLSLADLVLWLPLDGSDTANPSGEWMAVGHTRPTTTYEAFEEDVVGTAAPGVLQPSLRQTWLGGEASEPLVDCTAGPTSTVRVDCIPVRRGVRTIAVLTRHALLQSSRVPGRMESAFKEMSQALMGMIAEGVFPTDGAVTGVRRGSPRVADGVIRLTEQGQVRYASPNAVSALRRAGHRGPLAECDLAQVVTPLLMPRAPVDEALPVVLTGRAPWHSEVETAAATLTMRAIPLSADQERMGAVLLVRDVSELRRRERELLSKEATIREIHHRVKNNLQTVAALLRVQRRRVKDDAGAAALQEAELRIGVIALVHDALSGGFSDKVDFDVVAKRGLPRVIDLASTSVPITTELDGAFGWLTAEEATPLAMVLTEVLSNAVEHGLRDEGGHIAVTASRGPADKPGLDELVVTVMDNGRGWDSGGQEPGLGTQIVLALTEDLGGRITWSQRHGGGTTVTITALVGSCEERATTNGDGETASAEATGGEVRRLVL